MGLNRKPDSIHTGAELEEIYALPRHNCRTACGHCLYANLRTQGRKQILNTGRDNESAPRPKRFSHLNWEMLAGGPCFWPAPCHSDDPGHVADALLRLLHQADIHQVNVTLCAYLLYKGLGGGWSLKESEWSGPSAQVSSSRHPGGTAH